MSLKIKKPGRFLVSAVIAILLIIFVLVGFFTVMGKIIGFFTKKEEPQANTPSVTTSQGANHNQGPTLSAPTTDTAALSSLTVLVNKTHELPSDYEPTDLVEVALRGSRTTEMRKEAHDALVKLFEAADSEGLSLYCASGYRSYETQQDVYAQNVSAYGEEQANLLSAKAGQSEHQTGLSMDLTSEKMGMELLESFYDTEEGKWVADNAQKYGFIIRFPQDKSSITGYAYEPWHIRYVGVDTAKTIYDKKETLEEFLGQTN